MIKDLVQSASKEMSLFCRKYCKLKRNESLLQRITACKWIKYQLR